MKAQIARYGVLSHFPRPHRTEHVHIGIVVFFDDGSVRVHFGQDLKKLKAVDPTTDIDAVRSWEAGLPKLLQGKPEAEAITFIRNFGQWSLSSHLGRFSFFNEDDYVIRIATALKNLVSAPEKSARERSEVTRLHMDLKTVFHAKGWLGRDISNHQIVERHPLGPLTTAEFALQNGTLHVIESLDLRTMNPSAKRNDARSKALTLDMAQRSSKGAKRYAVLAGADSPLLEDAKSLLSDYSEEIFLWEHVGQMNDFMHALGIATGKPGLSIPFGS